jgi:hypothetical protein
MRAQPTFFVAGAKFGCFRVYPPTMPHSRCPACRSKHFQWIPGPSQHVQVDYYSCGDCGHVWNVPKEIPTIHHATSRHWPTSRSRRSALSLFIGTSCCPVRQGFNPSRGVHDEAQPTPPRVSPQRHVTSGGRPVRVALRGLISRTKPGHRGVTIPEKLNLEVRSFG